MSPVRDGPDTKFTARGNTPRSARISANASSCPATMRDALTSAIWVSGSSAADAHVVGLDSRTSEPVSAVAQKQPVMPMRSPSTGFLNSTASPAPAQSSASSVGHAIACVPSPMRRRYAAAAAGASRIDATVSTVVASRSASSTKRETRSSPSGGRGPAGWRST